MKYAQVEFPSLSFLWLLALSFLSSHYLTRLCPAHESRQEITKSFLGTCASSCLLDSLTYRFLPSCISFCIFCICVFVWHFYWLFFSKLGLSIWFWCVSVFCLLCSHESETTDFTSTLQDLNSKVWQPLLSLLSLRHLRLKLFRGQASVLLILLSHYFSLPHYWWVITIS